MQQVLKHLSDAVADAPIFTEPWPHVIVDNVFTPDYYDNILANLSNLKMKKFNPHRSFYWLVYGEGYQPVWEKSSLPLVTAFWNEFRETFFGALRTLLEEKFDVISNSLGAEIVHDVPGYGLGPHTDSLDKLVTGIFYLPKTADNAKQGTVLCRGIQPDPAGKGRRWGPEFKEVKIAPYVPNSALFFERTNYSYHGVRSTPVERWSLAYDLFR